MMVIGLRGPFGTAHDHPDFRESMVMIDAQHQGFPLPRRQGPDRLPQTLPLLSPGDQRKGILGGRKRQPFHVLMRQPGASAQRVTALVETDLIEPGPKAGLALEGPMMEEGLQERLLRHVGLVASLVAVQELVVRRRHPARARLLYSLGHAISAKVTRKNQEKCRASLGG